MSYIIIILALIAVFVFLTWRAGENERSVGEEVVGICTSALDQTVRKRENKRRIVALLQERGQLDNIQIRGELGISRTSVVRYMDELEVEGKVEQIGVTGRSVIYTAL